MGQFCNSPPDKIGLITVTTTQGVSLIFFALFVRCSEMWGMPVVGPALASKYISSK